MAAVNPDPAWPAVAVIGAGIMGSAMARNLVGYGAADHGVGPVGRRDQLLGRGGRGRGVLGA